MEPTSIGIALVALKKLADESGVTAVVRQQAENLGQALYKKGLNKTLDKALDRLFKKPDVAALFEQAFRKVAPGNDGIGRQFLLAVLSDPVISGAIAASEKGNPPRADLLIPLFRKILPGSDAATSADTVMEGFYRVFGKNPDLMSRLQIETKFGVDEIRQGMRELKTGLLSRSQPANQRPLFMDKEIIPAKRTDNIKNGKTLTPQSGAQSKSRFLIVILWLFSRINAIMATLALITGLVIAYANLGFKVSVSPAQPLSESHAFSIPFELSNKSLLSIYNVYSSCQFDTMTIENGGIRNIRVDSREIFPKINPDGRRTLIFTPRPFVVPRKLINCDLTVKISFKPMFWFREEVHFFRFIITRDDKGHLRYLPMEAKNNDLHQ